jgi:hypothetical protein
MPSEKELLERIRLLEEQNNELQDKLDAIYSILAPDYEPQDFDVEEEQSGDVLVNIEGIQGGGKPS